MAAYSTKSGQQSKSNSLRGMTTSGAVAHALLAGSHVAMFIQAHRELRGIVPCPIVSGMPARHCITVNVHTQTIICYLLLVMFPGMSTLSGCLSSVTPPPPSDHHRRNSESCSRSQVQDELRPRAALPIKCTQAAAPVACGSDRSVTWQLSGGSCCSSSPCCRTHNSFCS